MPISATGSKNAPFSLIGGDVVIVGSLTATVDLHVDGRVDGDISCAGLVQGQDSVIKGNVVARTARIAGTVDGSIAADELTIDRTARITGDVSYGSMSIEAGAEIEGRFARRNAAGGAGAVKPPAV
jgi:cytoskeletal protein CcmA (bactofilin family)